MEIVTLCRSKVVLLLTILYLHECYLRYSLAVLSSVQYIIIYLIPPSPPFLIFYQAICCQYAENKMSKSDASVVVCTDLSGKEPHRQLDVDRVMTSVRIGGIMVGTLSRNAGDIGLISGPGSGWRHGEIQFVSLLWMQFCLENGSLHRGSPFAIKRTIFIGWSVGHFREAFCLVSKVRDDSEADPEHKLG